MNLILLIMFTQHPGLFVDVTVLKQMVRDLRHTNAIESARLVRQLKRRERRLQKLQKNYDIVTAILQASSLKRREYLSNGLLEVL